LKGTFNNKGIVREQAHPQKTAYRLNPTTVLKAVNKSLEALPETKEIMRLVIKIFYLLIFLILPLIFIVINAFNSWIESKETDSTEIIIRAPSESFPSK